MTDTWSTLRLSIIVAMALGCVGCAADSRAVQQSSVAASALFAKPEPGVLTAGRLQPADLEWLRRQGVRHVIDLTEDAETPDFDEAAQVRAVGMRYDNLPIRGAEGLTLENVRAFDALLRAADRPVLVHCSSGNRVGAMAALRAAWIGGADVESAIAEGRRWGLKGLEPAVRGIIGPQVRSVPILD